MMLIQCTKKLLDTLPNTFSEDANRDSKNSDDPSLFSWHANLLTIQRRKAIALMNDKSRYVVVLYGLKKNDFLKLDHLIIEAIGQVLRDEGIKEDVVDEYLQTAGEVIFTRTKNRRSVARLNQACYSVQTLEEFLDRHSMEQSTVSKKCSQVLTTDGQGGYLVPYEAMLQNISEWAGRSIMDDRRAVLKVTLELEHHEVWRKLVVPLHLTFEELHRVIQVAFGWQDYHLHEFFVYGTDIDHSLGINHPAYNNEGLKPIMLLTCDEESLEYEDETPSKLEQGVKLSEYAPAKMKYVYDFGDDWRHQIDVEEIVHGERRRASICLDAQGYAPPEDVGGEWGYDEFLNIMGDSHHPEHDEMKAWARGQGYKKMDKHEINRRLQRMRTF